MNNKKVELGWILKERIKSVNFNIIQGIYHEFIDDDAIYYNNDASK